MSYPDYPNNRLIVNGTDLSEEYGMILSDGYVLNPPEPKTYEIDIPGGNGKLDLTEALLGDIAYGNREQEFTFYIVGMEQHPIFNAYEFLKTHISNFLHGRSYDYTLTMDPGYTYHGRFKISSYIHNMYSLGMVGVIKINVTANPFKHKAPIHRTVNAVGGQICTFNSGRERVRPSFTTETSLKIITNGKLIRLPVGTWTVDDLFFELGQNEVYLNSYDVRSITWGDLNNDGVTWGQLKSQKIFEWYKSGEYGTMVYRTWGEVADQTWGDFADNVWGDMLYMSNVPSDVADVEVTYDWGDL